MEPLRPGLLGIWYHFGLRRLLFDPAVHALFQHVHRQRAGAEQLVVEGAQIELVTQLLLRLLA